MSERRVLAASLGVIATAALALAGTAGSSPSVSPNLIKNGGFELPLVDVGGYVVVNAGKSWGGWKIVGASGTNVIPISTSYQQDGTDFVAAAGQQWLDLTGALSNNPTGVEQTVKTKRGASYRLSFAVGNVVDPGGPFGLTSTVNVLVNGRKALAATNKAGGKTTQAWKTFALTIKATSAATRLDFINGDPGTDNDNGLDSIALVKR